jgi:hypothetical protein
MVDWVHRDASHMRSFPQISISSRFSVGNIFVLDIAHLAYSRHAGSHHKPHFSRWHLDLSILTLSGDDLG